MNEFYRVSNPNEVEPTPETFLFKEIKRGLFVAQGSNGREWDMDWSCIRTSTTCSRSIGPNRIVQTYRNLSAGGLARSLWGWMFCIEFEEPEWFVTLS